MNFNLPPEVTPQPDPKVNASKVKLPEGVVTNMPRESYEAWSERYDKDKEMTNWEYTKSMASAAMQNAPAYFEETWGRALEDESIFAGLLYDTEDATKSFGAMMKTGIRDVARLGKMIAERALEPDTLSPEDAKANAWERHKEMTDYFYEVREKYAKAAAGGHGKYTGDILAGADFADPSVALPVSAPFTKPTQIALRAALKGGAKVGVKPVAKVIREAARVVSQGTNLPKKIANNSVWRTAQFLGASGFLFGGGTLAAAGGAVAATGITEVLSKIAFKTSNEVAQLARVFSEPSSHARFLFRLAQDQSVSQATRIAAARAQKLFGTKMYDAAFDGLVAGSNAAALQGALQYAATGMSQETGTGIGTGLMLGGVMGGGGSFLGAGSGSGKNPNSVNADGSLTKRSELGIKDFLRKKGEVFDKKAIEKLVKHSPKSAVLLSTMDAVAPVEGFRLTMGDTTSLAQTLGVPEDGIPAAFYDRTTKLMVLNTDDLATGVNEAAWIFAHEFGHHTMRKQLGEDLATRRVILDGFEDPDGKEFYFFDHEGKKIDTLEPVRLNEEAVEFADAYAERIEQVDPVRAKQIREDANALAEEMGAELFASMYSEDPNVFNMLQPQLKAKILGAARNSLSKFGLIDPKTGAENAILPQMQVPKQLLDLQKKYLKEQKKLQESRGKDVASGAKVQPKAGQTTEARFNELHGGMSWSRLAAEDFTIKDEQQLKDLKKALALVNDPAKRLAGIGRNATDQTLHPLIVDLFKNNANNPKFVGDLFDFLHNEIFNRHRITFGARTSSRGKFSNYNPYIPRDVTLYGVMVAPLRIGKKKDKKTGRTTKVYPSLRVVGYNNEVVESNVMAMNAAGLLKGEDPATFMNRLSDHAASQVNKTGAEGRINPQGRGENELFSMAFGLDNMDLSKLIDPAHKSFMLDDANGMSKAFVSYDIAQLAGASSSGKKGFAFDYKNVRDNYMPSTINGNTRKGALDYMPSTLRQDLVQMNQPPMDKFVNNLTQGVIPNLSQQKVSADQFIAKAEQIKGSTEFLNDIGIDKNTLDQLASKKGKSIDVSSIDYLINLNQRIVDLKTESSKGGDPIYEDYIERGTAKNYEEVVFRLPDSQKYENGNERTHGHWDDDDRVLMWYRKTDRNLMGKNESDRLPTYHLEEVQSDWHQYGKNKGYVEPQNPTDAEIMSLKKQKMDAEKQLLDRFELLQKSKSNKLREETFGKDGNYFFLVNQAREQVKMLQEARAADGLVNKDSMTPEPKTPNKPMTLEEQASYFNRGGEEDNFIRYSEAQNFMLQRREMGREINNLHDQIEHTKRLMDSYKVDENNDGFYPLNQTKMQLRNLERMKKKLMKEFDDFKQKSSYILDNRAEDNLTQNFQNKVHTLRDKLKEVKGENPFDKQAQAPFKKSWHSRALAEAITKAHAEGKRFVTWVTGERSAKQNSLDEHFESVEVRQIEHMGGDKVAPPLIAVHAITSASGRSIRKTVATQEDLAAVVGGEQAAIIYPKMQKKNAQPIEVLDIEVKAKGRRVHYDKLMVDAGKRFAKLMGTRPPTKGKIDVDFNNPFDKEKSLVKTDTQEVWAMELPKNKPKLPLYMPSTEMRGGEGSVMSELTRDYARKVDYVMMNSQVRDMNGDLMKMFHGTTKHIEGGVFRPDAKRFDDGLIFFHESPDFANDWIRTTGSNRADDSDLSIQRLEVRDRALRDEFNAKHDVLEKENNFPEKYSERTEEQEKLSREWYENFQAAEAVEFAPFRNATDARGMIGAQILPVYLNVHKLFDPRVHWDDALSYYKTPEYIKHQVRGEGSYFQGEKLVTGHTGGWDVSNPKQLRDLETYGKLGAYLVYENKGMVTHLARQGYDGMRLSESQSQPDFKTIAVWDNRSIKSATSNNGNFDTNDPNINHMPSLPKKPKPVEKSQVAYKLFHVGKDKKLYPLFVDAKTPVKVGEWLVAKQGEINPKTGKVKGRGIEVAQRAGWHASDLPMATHLGSKSKKGARAKVDTREPNRVWAEVEMANDFDWQSIARERAEYKKDGSIKAHTAHIVDQVPYNGYYRYKTNPNMAGEWLVSGQMKVNKVLSEKEVKEINGKYGVSDLPRREPQVKLTARDLDYMPAYGGEGKKPAEHGHVPSVGKQISDYDIDQFFMPTALRGARVFPVNGDRLMVGTYTTRSGATFECRGGHNHPKYAGHKGEVAWACGQSGDEEAGAIVSRLMKIIKASDGYAVTTLMSEEAVASNRTYARIMMDELAFDAMNIKDGGAIIDQNIVRAVAAWKAAEVKAAKSKGRKQKAAIMEADINNLQELAAATPAMPFENRKALLSKVMSDAYKNQIKAAGGKDYNAINWRDLYKGMLEFSDADGYRKGDMIQILKFDQDNPLIDLKDIGATPDPTYDISFRGSSVHDFEGHPSSYDFFKGTLDYYAFDPENKLTNKTWKVNAGKTMDGRRVGSYTNRMLQTKFDDPKLLTEIGDDNWMPPAEPIDFSKPKDTKAMKVQIEQRNIKNKKVRNSYLGG